MPAAKKIFAICDLDEHYVVRLSSYLNEKKRTPFEILAFTSLDSLVKYAGTHPIEILLISRQAMCDRVKSLNVSKVLILDDGEDLPIPDDLLSGQDLQPQEEASSAGSGGSGISVRPRGSSSITEYPMISKFQSTENLAREVMNYYSGGSISVSGDLAEMGVSVFAVSSPIARCGKTMFALTLSEILGEEKKTLYLNLEDFSGFEALFGETYRSDLTDLVYLSKKNEGSLPAKLEGSVRSMRNADYIPPAFFPTDLREISSGEWISFISSVSDIMKYKAVVLDIGHEPAGIPSLLNIARYIYMPVLPDPVSRAKLSQYEKDMEALSLGRIMERAIRLYLPEIHPRNTGIRLLEDLTGGEMGSYVRKLLAEEKSRKKASA